MSPLIVLDRESGPSKVVKCTPTKLPVRTNVCNYMLHIYICTDGSVYCPHGHPQGISSVGGGIQFDDRPREHSHSHNSYSGMARSMGYLI